MRHPSPEVGGGARGGGLRGTRGSRIRTAGAQPRHSASRRGSQSQRAHGLARVRNNPYLRAAIKRGPGRGLVRDRPVIRRHPTAPLLLLALLPGARAAAQSIPSPIRYTTETQSVNVYSGYLFTSPDIRISDSVSVDFGPRDAPVFGARYQVRVGGPFSFETGLAYSPSTRKL